MSEETLLSAARRVVRFWRIDEAHGGLTSVDTLIAMDTLALQIEKETLRLKRAEEAPAAEHAVYPPSQPFQIDALPPSAE